MTRPFDAAGFARVRTLLTIGAALTLLLPLPVHAQESGGDTERSGVRLGPLALAPTIGWRTEYDDNVFRSAVTPVSDVVSTVSARSGFRGQMRRVNLSGTGTADWVHYASLVSERGANVGTSLKVDFMFNRLAPYVTTSYDNSRMRLNPEIDLRPRIEQSSVGAGGVLHVGGKTSLDFSAARGTVSYDKTNVNGVSLRRALDRSSDTFALSLLQQVTPRTRISLSAQRQQDRFDGASQRGADNLRLIAGFESGGRISGRAGAGLRVHRPHDQTLPESRGLLVAVGTTITVLDRLQIGIDANRDLVPSYRPDISYYESYSYGTSFSYAIRRSLRILAQAVRRTSDYRVGSGLEAALDLAGVEHETRYGTGINYLLGDSMSIDFSGGYTERDSPSELRGFNGLSLRAGVSHAF